MDFKKSPNPHFRALDELSEKEADEEARALREGINYHDHLYYVKDAPEISDAVYDRLFQRLQDLEQAFPQIQRDDSPTQRVGSKPVRGLKKVRHKSPLQSLQATLNEADVQGFLSAARASAGKRSIRFVLEPKFDGLSVEVVYDHGRFSYGSTRGNGELGEDISHNLKTIHSLPLSLQNRASAPASLAVRGEVFMSKRGFTELNKTRVERGEDPFANPRNAAAGLMRQYESRRAAGKPLGVYFYEILAQDGGSPPTHRQVLQQLADWGLQTSPLNQTGTSFKDIQRYHSGLDRKRDDLDFEIDGIVIKLDEHELRDTLGSRDRSPRWALAWKFEPRQEVTEVLDIVVQVGRSGILTPVALLQPVDVGGVTVSRATLHNEHEVQRKDIRVGDRVRIIRAGDVIPEVEERVKTPGRKRSTRFKMPSHCPVCNAAVTKEGAYYRCTAGLSCAAQLSGRIQHYAGRDAMDIDHLGEKAAQQLVARELVQDLADLYTLKKDDLAQLEGFAERSAGQLYDAIQGAKTPRLDHFLFALGIPQVGQRVARQLAEEFRTLENVTKASRAQLEEIAGIGGEIAAAAESFFSAENNREVLERMRKSGVEVQPLPAKKSQRLKGKTFVFTGALEQLTRDQAREKVERLGARATSSVSGETDYLVVGKNPGSKLDDAKNLGVQCIDEQAFTHLLGGG